MISRRDIPNLLTIGRIVLVGPILWLLADERYSQALLIFAVAGISDGLDGYLAKRNGWETRLGSFLDPVADKLLLVGCYVVLGWVGLLPLWLVLLVLGRDVVIVSGALAFHFLVGRFDAEPTLISKINTFAQIVLVLAVIAHQLLSAVPGSVIEALTFAVVITTLASGIGYVAAWGQRARRATRDRRTG